MTDTQKKRGRPAGKKPVNKTRKALVMEIRQSQIELAEKLGVSKEKYVDELAKLNMVKAKKVNWQTLAKQLQAALESQIEDYTILETKVQMLEKEANEFADSYRRQITVISYLETKLGLNPI
jgi:DNA-binding Xre family transcriptional regulator